MRSTGNLLHADAESWQAESAERTAAIAALCQHPAMPDALRSMLVAASDVARGNQLLALIVSDRARWIMSWLALFLDASHDPSDPFSGLTVNRFKSLCAGADLASPGTAVAMLGLMRFAGYIEPATRAHRGVPLRLIPTEKLLGPQRERLRHALKSLALLRPEGTVGLARLDDPVCFKAFCRGIGEQFLARERLIEHGPTVKFFADRKAGLLLLAAMTLSVPVGETVPSAGPIPVSIKGLARQLHVARSQVRDLLHGGVEAGLLEATVPESTTYTITPRLRADIVGFVAALLMLLADAVTQAQGETRPTTESHQPSGPPSRSQATEVPPRPGDDS